jgi:hypothetical protein
VARGAWIDTGAADSCIDDAVALRLRLPIVDQQQVSGVGGQRTLNVYLAYIVIPLLGMVQAGRFVGAQPTAGGQQHGALIGRTLVADMTLSDRSNR